VTADKLSKIFGKEVKSFSMGGFGADSQKGALSAMGVIKCEFGDATGNPEAQKMQRGDIADVKSMVLKCIPQVSYLLTRSLTGLVALCRPRIFYGKELSCQLAIQLISSGRAKNYDI
jgi:hypothetical protein